MYCSKCGMQNSEEATLCVNCGTILGAPPQPAAQPGGVVGVQTCGLAIASLVMGILSIFCSIILAIPAVICGIIALVKISKSGGQLKGNGMAIAGIAVPVVVTVVITPMMLSILMPALSMAKEKAQAVVCITNMHEISTAMVVYMNDYDNEFPTPEKWCDLLIENAGVIPESFQCSKEPRGTFSYSINRAVYEADGNLDSQMVVLFESNLGRNSVGGVEDVALRHKEHGQFWCNIIFADGDSAFVTEDRIGSLKWTVE